MDGEREAKRFQSPLFIQYEKVLEDGSFALPVAAPVRDISTVGVSFCAVEKMNLHSKVRITFFVDEKKVSFIGSVVRIEISKDAPSGFLLGAKIEDINEADRTRLNLFIKKIDIRNVLSELELEGVIDIHFVAGYPPIIKKIGELVIQKGEPLGKDTLKSLFLNILDQDRYKKFMEEKEMNFVFAYEEGKRFRVNLHMQQDRMEAVFRLIPSQVSLPHQLGLPPVVEQLITRNKKGLILVAGRTGAGKTTTLASMVEVLNNKRKGIIISIEKPIEYIHANKKCIIKQREVGRDTLSFSNASKNALRQNPDVLVIGEILDVETMEVAIAAAETGMLVLTSIHAPDSSQALDRIISFFPAELQKHMLTRLSLVLKGIITQDLIPRIDGKGLIVAAEILVVNDAMKRVVRDGDWKQIPTIVQTGRDIGMQSMRYSLEQYFNKGLIDLEYLREYV